MLKGRALVGLQQAAERGALLREPNLMYNIYLWIEFSDDGGKKAREWLSKVMDNDEGLVTIAKSLTGESWSQSLGWFGGLGDRVSQRNVHAQIGADFDLFDTARFQTELERIVAERRQPAADIDAVETFLKAWANRREGRDD